MATAKKAAAKKAPAKKAPAKKAAASKSKPEASTQPTAIELLTADHDEVQQLFEDYEDLTDADADDDEKQQLAEQICLMLTVHAQIEEEIFYPAAKESLEDADLVNEAAVEHATAKDLIAQIQDMSPSDELYDAKVKVLGEYIEHHVREEEDEMFPLAEKSDMDLEALGEELSARKQELMAEMGGTDDEEEEEEA